jgi:glycerophosphoryl diester phosphodiesterase
MGADFVEPDLVITADGVLVARHEPEISGTTDVGGRPEFAGRRTVKEIDGVSYEGWFVEDFSLEELRGLRAVERIPDARPSNTRFDGIWGVPTFDEILALCVELSEELARPVGVIPETKHPSYFRSLGLPLEPPLVSALRDFELPVILQTFEIGNLQGPSRELDVELVQLVGAVGGPADKPGASFADMATAAGLAEIATYAHWVGPAKVHVRGSFVADAHAVGLKVMPYTLRREAQFLPDGVDALGELAAMFEAGVDGVFTDNPDLAVAARLALTRR